VPDSNQTLEAISQAALELAGERGWSSLTLKDIAIRAELSLAEVYQATSSKLDVLIEIQRALEKSLRASVEPFDPHDTPRDRVFDVVMVSLETLEPYRHGVEAIYRALPKDPVTLVLLLPTVHQAMKSIAELSGLETGGLKGRITADGLGLIWFNTFRVWLEDDAAELALNRMAELDKSLRRLEGAFESVSNCPLPSVGNVTNGLFGRT